MKILSSKFTKSLFLLALSISFIFIKTADTKSIEKRKVTNVKVIRLTPRKLINHSYHIGHLNPVNRVTVSSEIPGIIDRADFLVGQKVRNGQILVRFDTKRLKLNKALNQSNYNLALMDYKREKSLFIKNLSTFAKVASLKNRLDVNKFKLDLSVLDLDKSKVRSPLNGVVKIKYIEAGEYIGPGKKLIEIIDISKVLAQINIPEHEIQYVKTGKKVNVSLDSLPNKNFIGRIKTIGLEADKNSRSFRVEVEVNNPKQALLPGMLVRIKMRTLSMGKQILIPRHAIQEEERGSFVYIIKKSISVKKRVKIGLTLNNEVQILSGLKFGDHLVETGQQLITDKERVKVVGVKKQTS